MSYERNVLNVLIGPKGRTVHFSERHDVNVTFVSLLENSRAPLTTKSQVSAQWFIYDIYSLVFALHACCVLKLKKLMAI